MNEMQYGLSCLLLRVNKEFTSRRIVLFTVKPNRAFKKE